MALQALLLAVGAVALARLAAAARLPPLLGMIAAGVAVRTLGAGAQWGGPGLETIASPIRLGLLALVLMRAGLGISRGDLRAAGGLGLRLGLIPWAADALALSAGAVVLLGLDWPSAAVLGSLVAAISPAIVIPGLLDLLRRSPVRSRRVLQALLVGAPLDNIASLLALGVVLDLALGGGQAAGATGSAGLLIAAARQVGGGLLLGAAAGGAAGAMLRRGGGGTLATSALILVAVALVAAGQAAGVSFVIAVLTCGGLVRALAPAAEPALAEGMRRVWGVSRYALFGLIGFAVDVGPLAEVGVMVIAVVLLGQAARLSGAWLATVGARLEPRERLACGLAYVPKATIQAAFGALPLDRGLEAGGTILVAAVVAVALLAPLGVWTLHRGAGRLLAGGGIDG